MTIDIPVNINDTVYIVDEGFILKWIVNVIDIRIHYCKGKHGKVYVVDAMHPDGSGSAKWLDLKDFNKTWFADYKLAKNKSQEIKRKIYNIVSDNNDEWK